MENDYSFGPGDLERLKAIDASPDKTDNEVFLLTVIDKFCTRLALLREMFEKIDGGAK